MNRTDKQGDKKEFWLLYTVKSKEVNKANRDATIKKLYGYTIKAYADHMKLPFDSVEQFADDNVLSLKSCTFQKKKTLEV
jgi:hypothetical protein